MASDPAFLFYSSDFLVGTYNMTDEQVGQYMRLLCLQHQQGHLSEADMKAVMGGSLDEIIMCKFREDKNGNFFNKRLDDEVKKRKKYTAGRLKNLNSKRETAATDKATHMGKHKQPHMEDVIVVVNDNDSRKESTDEDTKLRKNQEALNTVFDTAARSGFGNSQAEMDKLNLIVADYGAEAVLRALDICVESKACTLRYLRGILNKDPTGGTLKKPPDKPRGKGYSNPFADDLRERGVIP